MKINKKLISFLFLFLISFFLRVYRIDHYISFHQDQVRDLFFIKNHFQEKTIPLLGPKASVGDFFLPPFWYYLMSLSYLISPSPLSPALLVATINSFVPPIFFLFLGRFFSKRISFLSGLLLAVSPLAIDYSRFAWNPNPIPLFSLLTFYCLYEILFCQSSPKKKEIIFFIFGTISANLTFQLHYQGTIIFLFFFLILLIKKKFDLIKIFVYLTINFLLILPLIIYEITNQFSNIKGVISFFSASQRTNFEFFGLPFYLRFLLNDFSKFISELIFFKNHSLGYLGLVFFTAGLVSFCFRWLSLTPQERLLVVFLIFSLFFLFIYKNSLINFYLLFLIPSMVAFLSLYFLKISKKLFPLLMLVLIIINLFHSPAFGPYDNTYLWLVNVAKTISSTQDYCLEYDLFEETFLEDKLRYLFLIQKNEESPSRCRNKFYICHREKCQLKKYSQIKKIPFSQTDYVQVFKVN
ncbi:MAG: glycosyltransferase family 39 protein [Patescibacteria group bacterium]|nr:glycosyltransferase family 39 protein [Patescibacteria group bacterium]